MNKAEAAGVLIALFALRCLLPLGLTLLIGYLMDRQVARWGAADAARRAAPPALITLPSTNGSRQPCWELRHCPPARRQGCPAFGRLDQPCWAIRLAAEGALPAGCPACPLYVAAPVA